MNIDREHLLAALKRARDPRGMKPHELADALSADEKGRHRVRKLLADLTDEGVLEKAEGTRYRPVGWVPALPAAPAPGPAAPKGTVGGSIRVHPAGYGFVERDDGEDDVFIAARNRGAALDGDRVAITTWVGFKGTEGRVVDVLQRGRARITGVMRGSRGYFHLEPDDPRLLGDVALEDELAPEAGEAAREGQAVVAEIVRYPTRPDEPMVARLVRVLGEPGDPRTEVAKVIACAEIPDQFPDEVAQAGARAPQAVGVEDEIDRVDLRDRSFLTIDPVTARDFDDAVCVEDGPRPGVDRLWVAVADVSHYVTPGSALDREARVRGVSVYLPDRAIPMLPRELSSGICSLNPEVDRLAMVARLDVDEQGGIVEAWLSAAVIRSHARLDYAGVAAALAGDLRGPRARYADHLPHLKRLQAVSHRLRAVRHARGSLDFEIPEAVVVLDEDDPFRVRDVRKSRSDPQVREAYRIVEDCMLAANEAVARYFGERKLDTLWRVHDVPSEERLAEFARLAEGFGIPFTVEDGRSPKRLRAFLEMLRGKPMERALSFLLLRSLKQAVYDVVNVGHFGLAAPDYLHFTSPIRRYPDLVVHRLLKNQLRAEGQPAGGVRHAPPPPTEELRSWAQESSSHERRAMEAEREVVDFYRAYLMRDRLGEEFDGTVVGVAAFGLFVSIEEPFVEGLVKIDALGDRFHYDENTVRLVADSGRSFALGDAVRVRIENVSVQRRKIDLGLVEHRATAPRGPVDGKGRHRAKTPDQKRARERKKERGREQRHDRSDGRNRGGKRGRR